MIFSELGITVAVHEIHETLGCNIHKRRQVGDHCGSRPVVEVVALHSSIGYCNMTVTVVRTT